MGMVCHGFSNSLLFQVSSTYGDSLPVEGNDDTDCLLRNSNTTSCQNDHGRQLRWVRECPCFYQRVVLTCSCVSFRIWDQIKRRSSYQTLPTESKSSEGTAGGRNTRAKCETGRRKPVDVYRELHHPIFQSIKVVHNPLTQSETDKSKMRFTVGDHRCSNVLVRHPLLSMASQTIVTLNSKVLSPSALEQCLKFIYCGSIDKDCLEIQVSETIASQANVDNVVLCRNSREILMTATISFVHSPDCFNRINSGKYMARGISSYY